MPKKGSTAVAEVRIARSATGLNQNKAYWKKYS